MITVNLPWPPTINHYYHQGRYLSKRARQCRHDAVDAVRKQLGGLPQPLSWPLRCEVSLCPPDRRKRDLDNYLKGTLDALTHANVWDDDSSLAQLHVEWGPHARPGSAVVAVVELA